MNIKIFILLIILSITGLSCQKQLNLYPHSAASSANLSAKDVELFLNGVYSKVQNAPGRESYIMSDLIGGNLITARGTGGPIQLINSILRPEQAMMSSSWNGYYNALYQVNVLLESASDMDASTRKEEILGTAHFFRGYIYYNLVSRWGGVPVLQKNTTANVARNTEAEVWAFIESELNQAIAQAPNYNNYYYVSKDAAKALMARVKLAQGKMTEAATLAEQLITAGNFKLDTFEKIFRNQQNTEEIFAFKNLTAESSIAISTLFYTYAHPVKGSYAYAPASDVMQLFEDGDKRKAMSIDVYGSDNVINKYPSGQSGTDPIIVTRLAEMYLISAEAQGLSGLGRLNQLRNTRGLPDVNPVGEAAYINAVLLERRKELLAEGFRWYDLVRLQKAKTELGITDAQFKLPIPEKELVLNNLLVPNPGYGN
ncbi:RagB/SusD family nutrient uptake outer membrane protein [Pedobacter heparinus]|uniref:RagB/SusD domain protein n=1 Tax=Pedobacter heparinus (strain ATCC 13125 / DSM 2366 / CIP 104194 / JCM 7457 / NBRC 12017 / NCIMB 9290 / NRRL B-14731 / HIM 762-3) TaxID=485917 RepID=C6XT15_PEDHD|nr:RagB/SusD family nutrient uptake outer membrane protein [Pedobacter heparinus]ACU03576.1 RagB/SusD domain protein [Pedobacter heparinus DSM 2366]